MSRSFRLKGSRDGSGSFVLVSSILRDWSSNGPLARYQVPTNLLDFGRLPVPDPASRHVEVRIFWPGQVGSASRHTKRGRGGHRRRRGAGGENESNKLMRT